MADPDHLADARFLSESRINIDVGCARRTGPLRTRFVYEDLRNFSRIRRRIDATQPLGVRELSA